MPELDINQLMEIIAIWGVPVLMAITFHEAAHGYVAAKYGDGTAYMLGRVTLNPAKHIDPFGTILMPGALMVMGLPALGYAKPVPVNFRNLKPYKFGVIAVAAAGPLMNFLLMLASLAVVIVAMQFPREVAEFPIKMAWASVQINLLLMVFNLLPIPPLDGSRILSVILPARFAYYYDKAEPYGMWIVLLLAITGMLFTILSPMLNWGIGIMQTILMAFS